jgi:hypothetical protein
LRRLAGAPGTQLTDVSSSLEARERRVADLAASLIGQLFRLRGLELGTTPVAPDGRPKPGPALDRELGKAIAVIADVPFEELQERGWHVQPRSFYWPLNDLEFLRVNPDLWARKSIPRGIDWDLDSQLDLMADLASFAPELSDIPEHGGRGGRFAWDNGAFGKLDAFAYYGIVRKLKPKRVVEVGAGASSLLLKRAVQANGDDTGVTLVEPYPRWEILGELPAGWVLHERILQRADLRVFEALEAGDILFYDGSHCVGTAGDVNWMLFEVLPRVAPGVWIHFHDIFWPLDYPPDWIFNEGLSWNEQYILQAFLMHNGAYRVSLAVRILSEERREAISELVGSQTGGGSVWIEKTG